MARIDSRDWARLSTQLDRLLDLSAAECSAALDEIQLQDPMLAGQLSSMLAQRKSSDDLDALVGLSAQIAQDRIGIQALVGLEFGAYTLIRPLGEGGMGSVWLARRNDGRFEGQVAIKLLHLSMLASQGEERLRREGNLLARLSHPHIARLLDAGVGSFGQPYLVLEYVEGEHLDRYCEARRLPIAERLQLMLEVLAAVAYAHANLVLHRDLKPANILVDTGGRVKLLDFGIGKLLQDFELTGAPTELTRLGGSGLTPAYAAPEQLRGEPVSTAADIYALGAILYQLLCGVLPQPAALRSDSSITATSPGRLLKPSVAALKNDDGGHHHVFASQLRGDLDWICLKALALEPERRYRSAGEFADDLQRHLGGRAVLASPDSWRYLLGKFVRRNRLIVAMVGIAVVALLGTVSAALWQAHAARMAAHEAGIERQRAAATRDFLVSVFRASDPRIAQDKPRGQITAKELLDLMVPRIGTEFAADPATRLELLGVVASIYKALDDPDRFASLQHEQVQVARQLYGELHPIVIDGLIDDAQARIEDNHEKDARKILVRADGMIHAAGLDHSMTRAHWWYARSDAYWSDAASWPMVVASAENAARLYEELAPRSPELVTALNQIGNLSNMRTNFAKAVEGYQRAIWLSESLPDHDDAELQTIYGNLAGCQLHLGQFDAAESSYAKVAAIARRTTGEGNYRYWQPMSNYARLVHLRGDRSRSMTMFAELLANIPESLTPLQDEMAADVRAIYASRLTAEGRAGLAIPLLEEQERHAAVASPFGFELRIVRGMLGDAYDQVGRTADARRALKESLDEWVSKEGPGYLNVLEIRERWGRFLLEQGDVSGARDQIGQVLAQKHDRTIVPMIRAEADLARISLASGDIAGARRSSEQALQDWDHVTGSRDVRLGPMLWLTQAAVLRAAHDPRAAGELAKRALAASLKYDAPGAPSIREAQRVVAQT